MLNLLEGHHEAEPAGEVDSAHQDMAVAHVALTTQAVVVVKGHRVASLILRNMVPLEILSTELWWKI